MALVISPPEQRIVLNNISWEMYVDLLEAHRDQSVPRFTYDKGQLEIMSPSPEHEKLKETITLLINVVAEERGVNAEGFGSTTFRREDIARGFEPDASFYIGGFSRVKGKTELDLLIDPPPDLIIEIDITHPSLAKFPIFEQLGVPEVWLHDGRALRIFCLEAGTYAEQKASRTFAGLTAVVLSRFLDESRTAERLTWLRRLREWAQQLPS